MKKIHSIFIKAISISILTLGITACSGIDQNKESSAAAKVVETVSITEQEVLDAQKAWGEGIVKIGKVYLDKGDYQKAALNHINEFYSYAQGPVLFKPTLAAEKPFRTDLEGALSYFVAGNDNYSEDHGFAIAPWSEVHWNNIGTKIIGNMAVSMGHYFFTPQKGGDPVKVEYTFAYSKNASGDLKIISHGSHLPYTPKAH